MQQLTFGEVLPNQDTSEQTQREQAGVALGPAVHDLQLAELLQRHAALLKRLDGKRRELKRFNYEVEALRAIVAKLVAPLDARGRELDEAVHGLFDTLLNKSKRSKRSKAAIRELYENLQRWGTLSLRTIDEEAYEFADDPFGAEPFDGQAGQFGPEPAAGPEPERAPPQAHRGRGEGKQNLRAMFLKLATLLHPDKVQDDGEKQRRTELMKDLNRAYRDGDVARILEIESSFSLESADGPNPQGEFERRCRVLETQNQLLAQQYREVLDDLRDARRSDLGLTLIDVRRMTRAGTKDPYQSLIEPIEESIETLQETYDHVQLFARDKIKLDHFLEGPKGPEGELGGMYEEIFGRPPCDCPKCRARAKDMDPLEVMSELLSEMADSFGNMPPMRSESRPAARAKKDRKAAKRQKNARRKNRKKS